jgi:1-acyl-sn-glycerol-3-phosphate acyltransferase
MVAVVRMAWRSARLAWITLLGVAELSLRNLSSGLGAGQRARARRIENRRRTMRRWCVGVCRALAVRVEVRGVPPTVPGLLVCNHLGYLDIPVLGSHADTIFVSKSEVADWPVIGRLATLGGTIYVERATKRKLPAVNEQIRGALERGDGVVVFPEGTSSGGDEVLPFRPSLLAAAEEMGLEVHAAGLRYATVPGDPPARESVCWWGDMTFAPHVLGLLKLREIRATVSFAPRPIRAGSRKELAQTLRETVSDAIRGLA